MQNKPNLPAPKMNVSSVKTMNYEQLTMNNEPIKQTQSNPIYAIACTLGGNKANFKAYKNSWSETKSLL
jgi:hypothetical protein